jgi:hypothetical protein
VSKKSNENFLNTFLELDKLCCEKFGIISGGVTEYITRLNNARFAPNRDEVLPRLNRYRNLRNRFAHEPGAIKKTEDISKDDIKWLSRFRKDVQKKRDPISKYLRKARRYAMRKKIKKILIIAGVVLAIGAAVAAYFIFFR